MRTIKQPAGSTTCVLACVAMLVDMELQDVERDAVLDTCSKTGRQYCSLLEQTRLLAKSGFLTGLRAGWETPVRFFHGTPIRSMEFKDIHELDAIATVMSRNIKGQFHAVVWDSAMQKIRDPDPLEPEFSDLARYEIMDWVIVQKIVERDSL